MNGDGVPPPPFVSCHDSGEIKRPWSPCLTNSARGAHRKVDVLFERYDPVLDTDQHFNIADTSAFVDNDVGIRIKAKPSNLKILWYSCRFIRNDPNRTFGQVPSCGIDTGRPSFRDAEAEVTSVLSMPQFQVSTHRSRFPGTREEVRNDVDDGLEVA